MFVFSALDQLLRSLLVPRLVHGESRPAPTTAGSAPFDESTLASSPRSLVLDRPFTTVAGPALDPGDR